MYTHQRPVIKSKYKHRFAAFLIMLLTYCDEICLVVVFYFVECYFSMILVDVCDVC